MNWEWVRKNSVHILLVVFVFYLLFSQIIQKDEMTASLLTETEIDVSLTTEELRKETSISEIYVDIKGEVVFPGVYRLVNGSRLLDVIELAGGVTEQANMNQINQSLLLTDQMMIIIPSKNQPFNNFEEYSINSIESSVVTISQSNNPLLNINTATLEELQTLSGIGPKKAEAILNYRQENGSFQTIDDLLNVDGIGEKIFEQLKNEIMVSP